MGALFGPSPAPPAPSTIKQIRSRALAPLRDQARTHQQRQHKEALEALRQAEIHAGVRIDRRKILADVIIDSARLVTTPVIASFGIETLLDLQTAGIAVAGRWVSVETNYSAISLMLHHNQLPDVDPSSRQVTDILNVVKGLIYHEMGHLLFSVPLAGVIEAATTQGTRNPGTTGESATDGLAAEDKQLLANWAYSILDDQRMESALTAQSPIMGRYLTAVVEQIIVTRADDDTRLGSLWPFLCGRSYLPNEQRTSLRSKALDYADEKGLQAELQNIEHAVD
ncbi:MAG: hypothetical protein ACKPBG_10420, partial [Actinomycetota bacterium]